jgi:hypothetical protein
MVATLKRQPGPPQREETHGELIRRLVAELVDTSYLCRVFNRSDLTVQLWRQNKGLPHVVIKGDKRDAIRYYLPEVTEWAARNNVRIFPVEPKGAGAINKAAD